MQYRIISPVKISANITLEAGELYEGFSPKDAAELIAAKSIEPVGEKPFANTTA